MTRSSRRQAGDRAAVGGDARLVLATDLDGTFLGGDAPARARLYAELRRRVDDVVLIFVTGRDLAFVDQLLRDDQLPRPDVIIADVGTTVVHGHDLSPVHDVQAWIDARWEDGAGRVRELLDGESDLEPQPVVGGRRVSYYYDPASLPTGAVARVEAAGFDVVTSADTFLDVLPRGVAKGPTLTRLLTSLSLPGEAVLVAGDTLNDLSLFRAGFRGVVVGNAEPRLLDAVAGLADVHRSPFHGCAGITDAIAHFGFFGR